METFTALLALCVAGWSISTLLAILLATAKRRSDRSEGKLREEFQQALALITRTTREQADGMLEAQSQQLGLLEKAFAQLRATNAWEYQAIMSMSSASAYDETYDPSPEAEAERIADRQNKKDELNDSLSAEEAAVLGDLFPGNF